MPTWQTKGTQGSEYAYSLPVIEAHSRAMTQLCNLARGHALSQGRTTICREDLKVVIKTVLSTAPIERVAIFDLLLANAGRLTTSQITAGLNTTNPTAKRTMTELKALGLVEKKSGDSYNTEWQIELVKEFAWFMSSEFAELREGFKPSDNRPYLKMLKEKSSPPTSDDLKEGRNNSVERGGNFSFSINENVFLKVFLDLQKESLDGTVRYDRLKRGLISSGKFTAGDAYQATKDAVKARILTVVDFEVYKIREENSN